MEEKTYRPSAGDVRLVGLRHRTSTFPGSTRSASASEIDHVVPWPHGPTTATNLQPLAPSEHRLEHRPRGWRVARAADDPAGDPSAGVVWRAPTGHAYPVAPDVLDDGPPAAPDWPAEPPW